MVWAFITFGLGFILRTYFTAVNKETTHVEMKAKRMTVVKSLSFWAAIILLSIGLFVLTGYLEIFGGTGEYGFETPSANCVPNQLHIVCSPKIIVRGGLKSVHKERFNIDMGAKLGYRKRFSKSENMPILILAFVGVWGAEIIFLLGLILYRIVIEPFVRKRR